MSIDDKMSASATPHERNGAGGLRRRGFLGALIVAPLVMPSLSHASTELVEVAGESGSALVGPRRPAWWGWTSDDERWHGFFGSREEAADNAAETCDGEGFTTGLCHPIDCNHPDYWRVIVEWLIDGGRDLGPTLRDAFEGGNMERDWEGEVVDAAHQSDWDALAASLLEITDAALLRAGIFVAEPLTAGVFEESESVIQALEQDKLFHVTAVAIAKAWPHFDSLIDASMMIDPRDEIEHPGTAVAE